jgi:enoyl-CoA hydratase/carnithine racemase
MAHDLIFSIEEHIGLITLNRQHALNALTHEMILALSNQLRIWELDSNIHAIVIQAAEGRAFCAGGDIRSLYQHGRDNPIASMAFFYDEYRLNHQIYALKKPYIALMDGFTFGGGVGISLHGAYPIASERFVFSMPETGIGFFPDIGVSHILSNCKNGFGILKNRVVFISSF